MHGASFFAHSALLFFFLPAEIRDISYLEVKLDNKIWRPEMTNI